MGKYLDKLRERKLEFNQSKYISKHFQPSEQGAKTEKSEIPTLTGCQKCQKPSAQAWEQSAAPDLHQLAAEVSRARRDHWITPTVPLMALWRAVNAHFGANLTSQQIGALSRLVEANAGATADELHRLCADLIRQGETN